MSNCTEVALTRIGEQLARHEDLLHRIIAGLEARPAPLAPVSFPPLPNGSGPTLLEQPQPANVECKARSSDISPVLPMLPCGAADYRAVDSDGTKSEATPAGPARGLASQSAWRGAELGDKGPRALTSERCFAWLWWFVVDRCDEVLTWFMGLVEPERRGPLAKLCFSKNFNHTMSMVILLNCLFSAYQMDSDMSQVLHREKSDTARIEQTFLAIFTFEVGLKLLVHRLYFFINRDWGWNCLDLLLVAIAGADVIIDHLFRSTSPVVNPIFLRSFRLLKLFRIARLFRLLRVLKSLRVMVKSLVTSCISLFWCILMLIFILGVISLLLMQGLIMHLETKAKGSDGGFFESEEFEMIMHYFHSVPMSILTLFQVTSGGDDWGAFYELFNSVHPVYGFLFVLYIAFFQFALVNILTGIIVENIGKQSRRDDEDMIIERENEKKGMIDDVKNLYKVMDGDNSGTVTWEEFAEHINSPIVQSYLQGIQVDVKDAEFFFKMLLDVSDEDGVPIDKFVKGCERMRGFATSIDLQALSCQVQQIYQSQKSIDRRHRHAERFSTEALAAVSGQLHAFVTSTASRPAMPEPIPLRSPVADDSLQLDGRTSQGARELAPWPAITSQGAGPDGTAIAQPAGISDAPQYKKAL